MAAITLANCTVTPRHLGVIKVYSILTPTTADDLDTIDVSTLFPKALMMAIVSSETDKTYLDSASATTALSITLPGGAASTDNEARHILAFGW